jgi:hypothetical protein
MIKVEDPVRNAWPGISNRWKTYRGIAERTMRINEAKTYINRCVNLSWTDRNGQEFQDTVTIFGVEFVRLYGPCFNTNRGDIRLDRVTTCTPVPEQAVG